MTAANIVCHDHPPADLDAPAWDKDRLLAHLAGLHGLSLTVGSELHGVPAVRALAAIHAAEHPEDALPSFTCPRCGRTSHNPDDKREGYCGACHDWTAEAKS